MKPLIDLYHRSPVLFMAAISALALIVWTGLDHLQWLRAESVLHGLVAFFLGLLFLIFLHAVVRLGLGAYRKGFRWLISAEAFRICAWAALFAVSSVVLFYNLERWRGKRAWATVVQLAAKSGEPLKLSDLLPPPVKAEENFAAHPVFAALYLQPHNVRGTHLGEWAHMGFWAVWPTLKVPALRDCPWLEGEATDFRQWMDFWRGWEKPVEHTNATASPEWPPPPAEVPQVDRTTGARMVLESLKPFEEQIEQVRSASTRPFCRFPLDYSRQMFEDNRATVVLNGIVRMLRVRASSEVALNMSAEAFEDVRLALKIVQLAGQQPWEMSSEPRLAIMADALQPVWEGLATKLWSAEQLAALQKELERLDPLQDYPGSVRINAFALANFCESVVPTSRSAPASPLLTSEPEEARVLGIARFLYPTGWSLQDQAAIHRARMLVLASRSPILAERRIGIELLRGSSDPLFPIFIVPRGLQMFTGGDQFLFAQAAVSQAALGCAIERYRLQKSSLPERLDSLVPGLVSQIPIDPIDDQPFRYRQTGPGQFVVYSIGLNRTDDNGTSPAPQVEPGRSDLSERIKRADWVWQYPSSFTTQ